MSSPATVFRNYPVYGFLSDEEEEYQRIGVPEVTGNLVDVVKGDARLVFTFMRPDTQAALQKLVDGLPPASYEWDQQGPYLWVVDVAAVNMSGVEVGRAIASELLERKLVEEGEQVFFRRNSGILPGRFGRARVRDRRR